MTSPLRVGVVGFGYWGPNLVRNLARIPEVEFVVMCDVSETNLAAFSKLYPDVNTVTDVDVMLADFELDAVVIATSAPSHYCCASKVLEEIVAA